MPQDVRALSRGLCGHASALILFGLDSAFVDFAAFHLAAAGLKVVPVVCPERLAELLAGPEPSCVLLHWDTLRELSYSTCAALKARSPTPVVVVSERLSGGPGVLSAFAAGADGVIEGAANPRIFVTRLRSILGQGRPATRYA